MGDECGGGDHFAVSQARLKPLTRLSSALIRYSED